MEYRITVWHGEGRTLFYILAGNGWDDTAWEVVETFGDREAAEEWVARWRALPAVKKG